MFGLVFTGIGILILWAAGIIRHIKALYNKVISIGWLMVIGGVLYWIAVSFLQDIFSNDKIMITLGVILFVLAVGVFIFIDPKKIKKKRGRKR